MSEVYVFEVFIEAEDADDAWAYMDEAYISGLLNYELMGVAD